MILFMVIQTDELCWIGMGFFIFLCQYCIKDIQFLARLYSWLCLPCGSLRAVVSCGLGERQGDREVTGVNTRSILIHPQSGEQTPKEHKESTATALMAGMCIEGRVMCLQMYCSTATPTHTEEQSYDCREHERGDEGSAWKMTCETFGKSPVWVKRQMLSKEIAKKKKTHNTVVTYSSAWYLKQPHTRINLTCAQWKWLWSSCSVRWSSFVTESFFFPPRRTTACYFSRECIFSHVLAVLSAHKPPTKDYIDIPPAHTPPPLQ